MMFYGLFLTILVVVVGVVFSTTFNANALTKFNVFVKTPTSPQEIIQTGGRLIERHIGYLPEAGFQGLLSVVYFASNDTLYNGVPGDFPSSDYEVSLANSYGMKARYVVANFTVESAKEVSAIMDSLPRPLYVHCHVSFYRFRLFRFTCLILFCYFITEN